jgi:hypothetical protein
MLLPSSLVLIEKLSHGHLYANNFPDLADVVRDRKNLGANRVTWNEKSGRLIISPFASIIGSKKSKIDNATKISQTASAMIESVTLGDAQFELPIEHFHTEISFRSPGRPDHML